jgi:hypothetical protein
MFKSIIQVFLSTLRKWTTGEKKKKKKNKNDNKTNKTNKGNNINNKKQTNINKWWKCTLIQNNDNNNNNNNKKKQIKMQNT